MYVPVVDRAAPGKVVALDLTDRGRFELSERVGPAANRIEGELRAESDTSYLLSVLSVRNLRGDNASWTGESLDVSKSNVARIRERQFSAGRTFLLAGATLGGILALILGQNMLGYGSDNDNGGSCVPTCEQ